MLKIVPRGVLKRHFPNGFKRGWELDVDHIPTAISALNQFMEVEAVFSPLRWTIRVAPLGQPYSKSKRIKASAAKFKRFHENMTVWIEDDLSGDDPGTLTIVAINAAMTLAQMGLQMLTQPKASDGEIATGVKYDGGLNTSTVGAAMAYLAGLKVWSGSQIIEAMVKSLRNAGGTSSYDGDQDGTLPGGGGTGDGSNPGVDAGYDWVDTGTWRWAEYDRLTVMGATSGGGRTMAESGQTYAQVSALMCPGGGRTDGPYGATIQEKEQSIYLDRVALRDPGTNEYNFQGVRWTYRPGELGQTNVGMIPGIPSSYDKAAGELTKSNTSGVITAVANADADYVEALIRCRLGWTSDKGNEKSDYMTLRFEVKRDTAASWTVVKDWNSGELRNLTGFDSDVVIPAPAKTADPDEGWRFRIIRTRDDEPDTSRTREATLVAWTEYQNLDYTYDGANGHPPAALLAVQQQAIEDGSGKFPEVAVLWSGRQVRVPNNYDPVAHTYTGLWNGGWDYKATENPVWLWLDMMTATDKMGLGINLTRINKFRLYTQAQYCDQMVGGKPRWTCNKQFADEKPFWEHIMEFCKSFRSVPYYDGAEYYLAMDTPGLPVLHFVNNDMVQDGLFEFNTTESETRYNEVEMEWDDPAKWYEKSSVTWSDEDDIAGNLADGATNNGIVSMLGYKTGCTSEEEAHRYARELGWCSLNEFEAYSFKTSLQAADYRPGDRIQIQDWVMSGMAPIGRVYAVNSVDEFVLPIPFHFEAGVQYKLHAQVGQTHVTRDLPIQSESVDLSTIYLAGHNLVEDAPVGIIEAAGVQLWDGIIRSVEEDSTGIFNVTCQQWVESKFAVFDGASYSPLPSFPVFDRNISKVLDLVAEYKPFMDPLRGSVRSVTLSWKTPTTGVASNYIIKHLAPSFVSYREVSSTTYTWDDIELNEAGQHRFLVQAVNMLGSISEAEFVLVDTDDASHTFVAPVFHRAF